MTHCALGPEPLQLWKHWELMVGRNPSWDLIHCYAPPSGHCRASQPGSLPLQDLISHLGMGWEGERTTLFQAQIYIREFVWSVNTMTHRTT